ncbi:DNA endonuclease SmrA [Shewanella sp. UCD-KL21]|uniref:DNA endonuclease SmrA n=1 Tax=Shewanella sp. UCD-KL21 TaxID=1917164 RepID=UPI000970EC91|nr:DNA endonuclease SmrA [Shewanella sp. UCD-KL21]
MNNDDSALFLAEMAGVKPIKANDSIFSFDSDIATEAQLARRAAAAQNEYISKLTIDPMMISAVKPEDMVSYKLDGVQDEVFSHLRLGKYKYQTVVDLHAYRLVQAREYLIEAIIKAHHRGERNILVIHGKGFKSKPYPGLMKSAVCQWLMQLDEVQAYHSATRAEGGTGAVFVMLVKSAQQRIEASETNRKGSGFR